MRLATARRSTAARTPLDAYLTEIDATPLLTADAEHDLAARVAIGDPAARDEMVRANLRLVVNIARSFTGRGLALEDLIAEGNMGLVRAVEGFDPHAGTRFSTYAAWWVRQSMRRAVFATGRVTRLPAYVAGLAAKWRRAAAAMRDESGRPPADDAVAARLGLTARQARAVQKALKVYASGAAVGGDGEDDSFDAGLADERSAGPGADLADAEAVAVALRSLDRLSDREAAVLRMRFGLDGAAPQTLREIGEHLGFTRERVRQIEVAALAQLRECLQAA